MIDFDVLKVFGTSNEQLKTFFTSKGSKDMPDSVGSAVTTNAGGFVGDSIMGEGTPHDKKVRFTRWLSAIIRDGRTHSLKHYRFFAAADLMWDSTPILPQTIPLQAYAQGRIDLTTASAELAACGCAGEFVEKYKPEGSTEEKERINFAKFTEVCVGIGRSYVSRRVDAQCNKYNNLSPAFKFDPRDTSLVGRCRAEAMSTYADIMADDYGYKHMQRQSIRSMLMYSRSLMFPSAAWDYETQIEMLPADYAGDDSEMVEAPAGDGEKPKMRSRIVREGVPFVNVHPSRVLYDTAYPLATLNTDTGCRWVGHWDVKKFGDICNDGNFFNTDRIPFSSGAGSIYSQNRAYFDLIYSGQAINFPSAASAESRISIDIASANDRKSQQGHYTNAQSEQAIFVTDVRVKVIPRDYGMGQYPKPVWLRLLVASDDTVIYAEWLPSLPAVYWGHNEDDSKMINLGQMHEIMPWQDQLSNIFTQLLMTMKRSLMQIIAVNTDVIDKETCGKLEKLLQGDALYQTPRLLTYSLKRLSDLGIKVDPSSILNIVAPDQRDSEYINNAFRAIVQILALVERLMMLSPQEQAQAAPREVSATEIASIESTTQVKFNAIGESCDEARAAWKKIIYESSMAFGSSQVELAVLSRFSPNTIKAAGFKPAEYMDTSGGVPQQGRTIIGSKKSLIHSYNFTSRDGGNRQTDSQSANILVSLMSQILPIIGPENVGKQKIYDMCNEIFRRVGAFDLRMEVQEGDDMQVGERPEQPETQTPAPDQGLGERIGQLEAALQQIAGGTAQNQKAVKAIVDALRNNAGLNVPGDGSGMDQPSAMPAPEAVDISQLPPPV